MRKGTLYVFTGPSGAGKGTVLSRLLSEDEKLFFSISATTRAPRPGEKDGVQYYFLTKEDFEAKIAANAFLEHAKYVDNYYGTLEAPVNEKLEAGYDVILEIEVQGAMQVHEKRPDAVMVFIAPPSFEELANRLRGRGTEDEAAALDSYHFGDAFILVKLVKLVHHNAHALGILEQCTDVLELDSRYGKVGYVA